MRPIPKPTDIHRLRFGTYPALLRRRNGQVVQLVRNGIRQVSLRQLDEIVLFKELLRERSLSFARQE